jgi:hypothetical protein
VGIVLGKKFLKSTGCHELHVSLRKTLGGILKVVVPFMKIAFFPKSMHFSKHPENPGFSRRHLKHILSRPRINYAT